MFPTVALRDPAPSAPRQAAAPQTRAAAATAPVILFLFILSLLPPSYFFLGSLRLSPTRLLLLLVFVPLLLQLLAGKAGRIRAVDVLLMLFMAWMVVTLVYNDGMARFPYAMMSMVELFGGYLIGRVLVRDATGYRRLFRYVLWALLFLAPFALVELMTNRNILQELSRSLLPTYFKGESSYGRLGLNRVMAGFEHPILYGLFCAAVFAPLLALRRRGWAAQTGLMLFVGAMTFAALSSAPLIAIAVQVALMLWARATGGRWWLLVGGLTFVYAVVDLLSNRTPITILINYITFDPLTAWTRVLTWQFGSAAMWQNPIFGIGLNDFARPDWLTPSVDNFWLLRGMRHGVVGVVLVIAALAAGFWAIARAALPDGDLARWRRAYLFALLAVYLTLCTVDIWGGTSSFVMLLVGAGVWLCDVAPTGGAPTGDAPTGDARTGGASSGGDPGGAPPEEAAPRRPYTRFPGMRRRPGSASPDHAAIGNNPGIATLAPPGRRSYGLMDRPTVKVSSRTEPDQPQR